MRKKTLKIYAFILTVIGLIALHFFFGLFTSYNYVTAKWDIFHNNPRILQFGLPRLSDEQAIKTANKFGFKYEFVAGCNVTTPLVNGIKTYNHITTLYLENKLGKNWKKKFDFQVDSLFRETRVDTIRKIILAIDRIKELDNYLDSMTNGKEHLYIWVLPQNKTDANVRVARKFKNGSIQVFEYYQVDPYSLKTTTIQNQTY